MMKKTIRDSVESLLARYENTRNNDKELIWRYWTEVDGVALNTLNGFLDTTPAESITRARRLLQEEGKFLPTNQAVLARRMKENAMVEAVRERQVV